MFVYAHIKLCYRAYTPLSALKKNKKKLALRHSPQSRLRMGSPTWTRAELVFWLIIMYVLFLRMQYGSCFDPVDPFRENGFLLIGQADEQTEEQDGVEGDRRV